MGGGRTKRRRRSRRKRGRRRRRRRMRMRRRTREEEEKKRNLQEIKGWGNTNGRGLIFKSDWHLCAYVSCFGEREKGSPHAYVLTFHTTIYILVK